MVEPGGFPSELEGTFFARGTDDAIRGLRLSAGSGALFDPYPATLRAASECFMDASALLTPDLARR